MEVTSHTGCVSRNAAIIGFALGGSCHIPHGMCEQKFDVVWAILKKIGHIPHGMCEQKFYP